MNLLIISQLAKQADVNLETIRFYQRKGLIAAPEKPQGGIRRYGEKDVARVRFIKAAQRLGFTLVEIAQLLKLDDGAQCGEAREIAMHKLEMIRQRLANLQSIEAALAELVNRCTASRGRVTCPLIASLREHSHTLRMLASPSRKA